jgi:hypothetical protein
MDHLQFTTPGIATVNGFLSTDECSGIVSAMKASSREPAQIVRAGESILDESIRFCFDHHFPEEFKRPIGNRMAGYFDVHRSAFGSDADYIYGPYFMSYEKGSYFRAHRDVANHKKDPARLAAHRWSLVLYLNGRQTVDSLPTFEGGALIIYETDPKLRDRRVVIVPQPGMLLLFRSSLMHEVALVRQGTRYAVAGWMASSTSDPLGGYR